MTNCDETQKRANGKLKPEQTKIYKFDHDGALQRQL